MRRVLLVWYLMAALLLAACGGSDEEEASVDEPAMEEKTMAADAVSGGLPEVNPLEVRGDIITAGSSTVFPLSEAMAERFKDEGYAYNITIDSIGSAQSLPRCQCCRSTIPEPAIRATRPQRACSRHLPLALKQRSVGKFEVLFSEMDKFDKFNAYHRG